MPPIRKLARDLGVDLVDVDGSGPQGRILRSDIEAVAQRVTSQPAPSSPVTQSNPIEQREPLRGVRRTIAQRMAAAHRIVPPVTHVEECDVTELDATRRLANERAPGEVRLTFLPFIVKAVATALRDYPALNASLDEVAGEIVYHSRLDIGVAVDTPAGLVVPVIRDSGARRLRDIAGDIDRLARSAREGRLTSGDLDGGTFTVTSPGPFGGLMATPIVMHPQSAILGVHRAGERPVVRDGQIVARLMMNLSITFDHRLLDGMTAARFILDLVRLLEHPAVLALEA
jgi:pyruvate dehydrogenase E2 component (dihydrolipoamide acetyltransferase)